MRRGCKRAAQTADWCTQLLGGVAAVDRRRWVVGEDGGG